MSSLSFLLLLGHVPLSFTYLSSSLNFLFLPLLNLWRSAIITSRSAAFRSASSLVYALDLELCVHYSSFQAGLCMFLMSVKRGDKNCSLRRSPLFAGYANHQEVFSIKDFSMHLIRCFKDFYSLIYPTFWSFDKTFMCMYHACSTFIISPVAGSLLFCLLLYFNWHSNLQIQN